MTDGIVLATGGSGQLGLMFPRHSGDRYRLRLTYKNHPLEAPGQEVVKLDVTDYAGVLRAMQGVDTVVHFAADSAGRGPCSIIIKMRTERPPGSLTTGVV